MQTHEQNHKAENKKVPSEAMNPDKLWTKSSPRFNTIEFLHQTFGNRAVQQLLKSGIIQAKLKIGSPNDLYEQEADKVADLIIKNEATKPNKDLAPIKISRRPNTTTRKINVPSNLESQIDSIKSKGQPLDQPTRDFFEPYFGDLSDVKIHTGEQADQMNESINARAFTYRNDIVFSSGQYSTTSYSGKKIIAHELAHVKQQSNSSILNYKTSILQREVNDKSLIEVAEDFWGGAKKKAYSWLINGLRNGQRQFLSLLKKSLNKTPDWFHPIGEQIIFAYFEVPSDLLISFALAVIAVIVGFTGGIIKMVIGLFTFLLKVLEFLAYSILQLFSKNIRDQYLEKYKWQKIIDVFKNFGPALGYLLFTWVEKWKAANYDEKTIMLGELTGEIEALIASFMVAGGVAGKMPKLPEIIIPLPEPAMAIAGSGKMTGTLSQAISIPSVATGPPIAAGVATGTMMTSVSEEVEFRDLEVRSREDAAKVEAMRKKDTERLNKPLNVTKEWEKVIPREAKDFEEWFDSLTLKELKVLWADEKMKKVISDLIREPGGLHEWLKVSKATKLKKWGVSMQDIHEARTLTERTAGKTFGHGKKGSSAMHNKLDEMFDTSVTFEQFKWKLNDWADKEMPPHGRKHLPAKLQVKH